MKNLTAEDGLKITELLFQPALANISRNGPSSQKLKQICSICDLEVEGGKFFEHLASAHGDSKIKIPATPEQLNLKANSKNINEPENVITAASLKVINQGNDPIVSPIFGQERAQPKPLTLEEKIEAFNIKPCEIKLTKCDNLINCGAGLTFKSIPVSNSKIQEKVTPEKSKLKMKSAKTYLCLHPKCKKKFKLKHHLKIHSVVHSGEKPYKCKVCFRRFTQNSSLNRHSRIHIDEQKSLKPTSKPRKRHEQGLPRVGKTECNRKLHKCSFPGCNKPFRASGQLQVHYRIHTGEKPFQCKVCLKRFNQACYLPVHSRIHTGDKPFQCKTCFKRFSQSYSLTIHVRNIHGKSTSQTSVRKIQKQSFSKNSSSKNRTNFSSERQKSISNCGLKKNDLLFQSALANIPKNEPCTSKTQICSISDLEVQGGTFLEHLATAHTDSKESSSPEKINSRVTATPKKINESESVVTAVPLKLLNQRNDPIVSPVYNKGKRQISLSLEEKIEAFNIKPCGIKLTKCDDLINHEVQHKFTLENNSKIQGKVTRTNLKGKTNSARQKLNLCMYPKCKKYFKSTQQLEIHSRVHSGEKRYKCRVCCRRFTQKSSLNRHSIIHIDGQKSLKCTSQPSKRLKRSLSRIGETECNRKLHKCSFPSCEKAFRGANELQIHYRIHTGEKPFQCKVCLKRFNQSSYLTVHQRIHTGDKPFECKVCLKRFTQSCSLSAHARIHTGDKPFQCTTCFKQFSQSCSLALHVRNIHKKSPPATSVTKQEPKESKRLYKMCLKVKPSKDEAHLVKQTKPPAKKVSFSLQTPKENVFACLGCSKRDTNLSKLELHIKQAHGLELGANFDRTLLLCKTSN